MPYSLNIREGAVSLEYTLHGSGVVHIESCENGLIGAAN